MSEDALAILDYRAVSDILTAVGNRRLRSWEFLEVLLLMQTISDKRKITYWKFKCK